MYIGEQHQDRKQQSAGHSPQGVRAHRNDGNERNQTMFTGLVVGPIFCGRVQKLLREKCRKTKRNKKKTKNTDASKREKKQRFCGVLLPADCHPSGSYNDHEGEVLNQTAS